MTDKVILKQGTKLFISSAPTEVITTDSSSMTELSDTAKTISFKFPAKPKIDVSTLKDKNKRSVKGAAEEPTLTISANFKDDNAAQEALRSSYDNDEYYGFIAEFTDGRLWAFIASVDSHSLDDGDAFQTSFELTVKGLITRTTKGAAPKSTGAK